MKCAQIFGQGKEWGSEIEQEHTKHDCCARPFCRVSKMWIDAKAIRWDYPTVIVSIDSKRRLTVPAALAPTTPGDYFDAQFDSEEDAIVFRRLGAKHDWLTVMKECPLPIDDLPARRREFPRRRKL